MVQMLLLGEVVVVRLRPEVAMAHQVVLGRRRRRRWWIQTVLLVALVVVVLLSHLLPLLGPQGLGQVAGFPAAAAGLLRMLRLRRRRLRQVHLVLLTPRRPLHPAVAAALWRLKSVRGASSSSSSPLFSPLLSFSLPFLFLLLLLPLFLPLLPRPPLLLLHTWWQIRRFRGKEKKIVSGSGGKGAYRQGG